jgi:hypothetical protein
MIREAAEQLILDRAALRRAADREIDLDTEFYYTLETLVNGEWEDSYFRHNSKGLVMSFASLYHAGKRCRITQVKRIYPGSYSGTIGPEKLFTPHDVYCGLTEAV